MKKKRKENAYKQYHNKKTNIETSKTAEVKNIKRLHFCGAGIKN